MTNKISCSLKCSVHDFIDLNLIQSHKCGQCATFLRSVDLVTIITHPTCMYHPQLSSNQPLIDSTRYLYITSHFLAVWLLSLPTRNWIVNKNVGIKIIVILEQRVYLATKLLIIKTSLWGPSLSNYAIGVGVYFVPINNRSCNSLSLTLSQFNHERGRKYLRCSTFFEMFKLWMSQMHPFHSSPTLLYQLPTDFHLLDLFG